MGQLPAGPIRENDAVHLLQLSRGPRAPDHARAGAEQRLAADGGKSLPKAEELDAEIPRNQVPGGLLYVTMTQYDPKYALQMVIPPESMDNLLANVMSVHDLRNLRVAETEKYAHVTYFFNGGIEKPFGGEERELVQSQKVATYDLAPEMSANGIADVVCRSITDTAFDVIIVNFANADMVGHSGKMEPTVKAVEVVDACLGRIYDAVKATWSQLGDYRRPRQCGAADRSRVGRPAHGAYDQSGAVHSWSPTRARRWVCGAMVRCGISRRQFLSLMELELPKQMTGGDLRVRLT